MLSAKNRFEANFVMAIYFSTENINFNLKNKLRIKKWIAEVIKREGKTPGDIGYVFCDDAYLLEANIEYLNHDTYTDIITFDYVEGDLISGDMMISVDRIRENATIFGVSFEQELHRVIIHGVLHLLGNKDKSEKDAAKMRKLEEKALAVYDELS